MNVIDMAYTQRLLESGFLKIATIFTDMTQLLELEIFHPQRTYTAYI